MFLTNIFYRESKKLNACIKFFIPSCLVRAFNKLFNPNFKFKSYPGCLSENSDSIWINNKFLLYEERRLEKLFAPSHKVQPPIISLFLNTLSKYTTLSVLDWGGGTGYVWFSIYKSLLYKSSINWTVLDNKSLQGIGQNFSANTNIQIDYTSCQDLQNYNVLYINSALQYVLSWKELLSSLLQCRPEYLVFESLYSSPLSSFTVIQSLYGSSTPCNFIHSSEFIAFIESFNYQLLHYSVNHKASNILISNFSFPSSELDYLSDDLVFDLIFVLKN
jgi:putative methyltransferase (TIGR04325 family)